MDIENRPTLLQLVYREAGLEQMGVQVIDSLSGQPADKPTGNAKHSSISSEERLLQLLNPLASQAQRNEGVAELFRLSPLEIPLLDLLGLPSDPRSRETSG